MGQTPNAPGGPRAGAIERKGPRGEGRRRCPICDLLTELELCPEHQIATMLAGAVSPSIASLQVGAVVAGRYVLQRVIGKGGYGAVFEARHTGTGQGVAVKTLAPGLEADDLALRRFFQEARVTAGLKHPNTIRVFDFGQDDSGLIYLAMELLTGVTLKQELKHRVAEGRVFSEREAIEIGVAITRALGEAHAAGLVHRDLKPDNVFLHRVEGDDPVVKVLDFGIVKLANSSLTLGSDSGIPGTPAYMSPEQITKRGEIDGRADLYSLAVLLYNLVSGTVPFRGADVMQTLYLAVHDPVPDVRQHARTPVSARFAELLTATLAKDPADRPQDARELRDRLRACLDASAGEVARPSLDPVAPPPVPAPAPATPAPLLLAPELDLQDTTLPARPRPEPQDLSGERRRPDDRTSARAVVLLAIAALSIVALVLAGVLLDRLFRAPPARSGAVPPAIVPSGDPRRGTAEGAGPSEPGGASPVPADEAAPDPADGDGVTPSEPGDPGTAPQPRPSKKRGRPRETPADDEEEDDDALDIKI